MTFSLALNTDFLEIKMIKYSLMTKDDDGDEYDDGDDNAFS